MNNDQQEELLKRFLDEFGSVRIELKAITQKLENMEKNLAYAFPKYKEMRLAKKNVQTSLDGVDFKQLKKELQSSKDEYAFQKEMERYGENIVFGFAEFLGIEKLTDREEAYDKIAKKLNASLATGVGSSYGKTGVGSAGQAGGKSKTGNPQEKPKAEISKHNGEAKSPAEEAVQDESEKPQPDGDSRDANTENTGLFAESGSSG